MYILWNISCPWGQSGAIIILCTQNGFKGFLVVVMIVIMMMLAWSGFPQEGWWELQITHFLQTLGFLVLRCLIFSFILPLLPLLLPPHLLLHRPISMVLLDATILPLRSECALIALAEIVGLSKLWTSFETWLHPTSLFNHVAALVIRTATRESLDLFLYHIVYKALNLGDFVVPKANSSWCLRNLKDPLNLFQYQRNSDVRKCSTFELFQ